MNITFRQLSVFVSIARHGSMTAAADALFMTKGAISQTLAELENQLGVRLFDRLHARLFINHEGQKLLPVADELLSRMQGWNGFLAMTMKIHVCVSGAPGRSEVISCPICPGF